MNKHKAIIEGLSSNRKNAIYEEVTPQAKSSVDKFMKEQKASPDIRKKMTNILNHIYLECNKIGENLFTGGTFDYTRGDMVDHGDAESGPDLELYPSIHELKLGIKFTDKKVDIAQVWKDLVASIDKNMKKNYKEASADGFSYDISIDTPLNSKNFEDIFGFYISIEKPRSSSLIITLGHMTNPLNEAAGPTKVKQIRYYKGSKPQDRFTFEFTKFNSKQKGPCLKINVTNDYWDKSDYAFIPASNLDLSEIYSYSSNASDMVKRALSVVGYKKKDFEKIYSQLLNHNENSGLGTEVGLPIDKENCENTTITGIATPDGRVGVYHQKRKNIVIESKESEGKEDFKTPSEDEKESEGFTQESEGPQDTISCPKCHSLNVNVVGVDRFYCSDCSNEWRDVNNDQVSDEKEEKDGMLDNSEDEPPLKVYTTSYSSIY